MREVTARAGDRLCCVGGLPTHELFAEAFFGVGVTTNSSAIYNFVPGLAVKFFRALCSGDRATVRRVLKEFFFPFARIRDRRIGYSVSIIKAGVRLIGRGSGPVRPPLTDLSAEEERMLQSLLDNIAS